ncbi:hypothetical protein VNO77_30954 [Canavalia gladiata]|uniref:Uncharacterized protein n=1 Tax=Canavalia gladiata TaxID=3824 RepID=A0AAN9KPY2_CANGL
MCLSHFCVDEGRDVQNRVFDVKFLNKCMRFHMPQTLSPNPILRRRISNDPLHLLDQIMSDASSVFNRFMNPGPLDMFGVNCARSGCRKRYHKLQASFDHNFEIYFSIVTVLDLPGILAIEGQKFDEILRFSFLFFSAPF